jgi:hypothetical protein
MVPEYCEYCGQQSRVSDPTFCWKCGKKFGRGGEKTILVPLVLLKVEPMERIVLPLIMIL